MANRFEKGKHIFFLFKNGCTVQDSQLKPRYYLELDRAKQYLPYGDEIIEYAPVRHGRWMPVNTPNKWRYQCDQCNHYVDAGTDRNYCPNCGAKMDKENDNG